MKKTISHKIGSLTLSIIIAMGSLSASVIPVNTAHAAVTWNIATATHLANRALIDPTQADIQALLTAGSANAAVELLFAAPSNAEKTKYESILDDFYEEADMQNAKDVRDSYVLHLWKNPEEAKEKLFLLFEDILTVDLSKTLETSGLRMRSHYADWHNTIYESLDESYPELIKRTMREFAQAHYLNVLNGNKNSPNQDYARELLQLFLMEERPPVGSDESAGTLYPRNYTEEEMINLSYLVTGYRYQTNMGLPTAVTGRTNNDRYISFKKPDGTTDSSVWFDRTQHNTTARMLFGANVSTPVGKDPADIVIPYIFSKRQDQIAQFIGSKLIKHYVHTQPTRAEIDTAASLLKSNNFNLINATKALLKHDIMYSATAMNEYRYKSPVELVVGIMKKINPPVNNADVYSQMLPYLDYVAVGAPTIFGRDGMDTNDLWMDSAKYGSWASFIAYNFPNTLLSRSTTTEGRTRASLKPVSGETTSQYMNRLWTIINPGKSITAFENRYTPILTGMLQGNISDAELNTILGDMLSQPEYMLLSGHSLPPDTNTGTNFNNDHVVVYHWLGGAPDIQHLFPPIHDPNYELIKGPLAVKPEYQAPLVDKNGKTHEMYRANKYALGERMLNYYKTGQLSVIQGSAEIGQSQAHNQARIQAETGTLGGAKGYITKLFESSPIPATQVQARAFSNLVNGMSKANMPTQNVTTGLSTAGSKNLSTLLGSNGRSLPGQLGLIVSNALDVATIISSKSLNLSSTAGQFDYFLELVRSKNALIMVDSSGGFDSHRDQAPYLVGKDANGGTNVAGNVGVENSFRYSMDLYADMFEKFKTQFPTKKITIVLYGEFGRTTVPNATYGTDHGRGGLFMVLSSDPNLMKDASGNALPQIIGRINTNDNQLNYQEVKVEIRSIWHHLFSKIYNKNIFGTQAPIPLATYAKMDELYDLLHQAKGFDPAKKDLALAKVELLKGELANNTFAKDYFLGRLEEINNHFARSLSLPENHNGLFASFSFENNVGDASYHGQQLKETGTLITQYDNGISGKGLILRPGEEYDNDKYNIYTPALAKNPQISTAGNSLFFWVSPKELKTDAFTIFEQVGKGVRISLSATGTGGKKLQIDHINGTSVTPLLPASSTKSPLLTTGQWAHIGIINDVSGKKTTILINGTEAATLSNPSGMANNYRYRFGSPDDTTKNEHSVIIDEFMSYGKVMTVAQAQAKYAEDALANMTDKTPVISWINALPNTHSEKARLLKSIENIARPAMSHNMKGFTGSESVAKSISQCVAKGSSYPLDGIIKLRFKGGNIFTNENFFRSSIDPVFLKGIEDGSIDFLYDQSSKMYTFKFNGKDEELWTCYFENSPFFIKFFEIAETKK